MSSDETNCNFRNRLKISLVIFPFLTGMIVGILEGIYILFTSQYIFWNVIDKCTFLIISITTYSIIGILIAIIMALLPVKIFFRTAKINNQKLPAFYLSVFIVLLPVSVFLMKIIPFSLFNINLMRNVVIILSSILLSIIFVCLIYSILVKSKIILNSYFQIYKVFKKRNAIILVSFLIIIFGLNYIFDKKLYPTFSNNSKRPNIIFISLDTLGARHLSSYGYSKKTSPYIDKLAKEGVLFENTFSHSKWTLPSHMSMFTSTYPVVHDVNSKEKILDDSFVTMAEILKQNGYFCGAFVDRNRFSHIGAEHGFDQGFDFYEHYPERFNKYEKFFVVRHIINFLEEFLLSHSVPIVHSENNTNQILSWIKHYNKEKPFFLFLHYDDIHSEAYSKLPYVSPEPYQSMHFPDYKGNFTGCDEEGDCSSIYLTKLSRKLRENPDYINKQELEYITSIYDGGITYVDYYIGKLFQGLKKLEVDKNTLVILTSDHGEEFFEHGLFLHGQFYDEIIHVPLIMVYPGKLPSNIRINPTVRLIDILPTVLELLDIKSINQIQGTSLLPGIFQDTKDNAGIVFGGLDKRIIENLPIRFVRTDSYKLITKELTDSDEIHKELYNLKIDPLESTNILEKETKIASKLEEYLLIWNQDCENLRGSIVSNNKPKKNLELDEKTLKELKSLGYIK